MARKFLPSLAVAAFAAILFQLFSRRGDQARSTEESARRRRARGNDGTARGASSTDVSTEGQEVAASSGYDYEVFLSFRGPDTRTGFTDFLYTSLKDAGIRTFRDDEELRVGEEFAPELLQAIKQSKISIPIFSKGYASSPWCLRELVKMVECQENGRQKIMPIFYDVAPYVVRHQIEDYAKAFRSHEKKQRKKQRYDEETIPKWKAALSAVGAINGWDLHSETNRKEGAIAKTVTKKIFNELRKAYLVVSDKLVSVDDQVDKIMEMVDAHKSETLIVGIYGMGGIGKTTIAKIIYNQLSKDFQHYCFLSNVRETSKLKGIHWLQHQLVSDILNISCLDIRNIDEGIKTIKDRLSDKKVLLLLDDVEEKDHMNAIVGDRDWFGKGSKIIITTRRKDVLISRVDYTYEVNGMNDHQSLQLFSKHAFRRESPLDEYINQSKWAIRIAGGLPLTLEVMGSLLSITNKKNWDATLKMLESVPHNDVQNKLKISYDALNYRQKHIFLDIACFFIGYDQDIVVHFWDESKFPKVALEVLQNMSLIKIEEDNKVWMHDQLRDFGREMVHQESEMNIEKQSRVWNPMNLMEALDLLRRHEGKIKVEALCLHFNHEWQYRFTYKDFERISSLRFLKVYGLKKYFCAEERLLWHESPSNLLPICDFQENPDLLPKLRWLSWVDIPPTFKITNFSMKDVVILDLSHSDITNDWQGWSHMKVMNNLKVMNLTNCSFLDRTPDFLAHSKLERLILQDCYKLVEIDKSICQLKSLVFLEVSQCMNLRRLPDEMGRDLKSLKYLYMNGCISLERLPNTIGNLELLNKLDIPKWIKELPNSIGNLKSLIKLDISHSEIKELPDSIGNLKSLIKLDISSTVIKELPDSIGNLKSLIELDISSTMIKELPNSIGNLKLLKKLNISKMGIKELPDSIGNLESLIKLHISGSEIKELPDSIGNLKSLIKLDISGSKIKELPDSIGNLKSLIELDIIGSEIKELPDSIGNLKLLNKLNISKMGIKELPDSIGNLESLIELDISGSEIKKLPDSIGNLESLIELDISESEIKELPDSIGNLKSLNKLNISQMGIEELPSSIGNLESLIELDISESEIKELPDSIGQLKNLKVVDMTSSDISKIPDAFWTIEKLEVVEATDVVHFNGEIGNCIYKNRSMRILRLEHCRIYEVSRLPKSLITLGLSRLYMDTFPDLSNLTNLKELCLWFMRCDSDGESDGPVEKDLPRWIGNLSKLESLDLRSPYVTALPTDMRSLLPQLKSLKLQCPNLGCLPSLPSSLSSLDLESECVAALPTDVSSVLPRLEGLSLKCPNLRCLPSHPSTSSELDLKSKCVTTLPTDMSSLFPQLQLLQLQCPDLSRLPSLPPSLKSLYLWGCESCCSMEDLSNLKTLSCLEISKCAISEIQGLDHLENLKYPWLDKLQQVKILPDLRNLNELWCLKVSNCDNLVEIQGELPSSLRELVILGCGLLRKLPDLSSLKGLRKVEIKRCGKLNVEEISSLCLEKAIRFVGEDDDSKFESIMNVCEEMTILQSNLNMNLREKMTILNSNPL